MRDIKVNQLIWDDYNISQKEVEEVFNDPYIYYLESYNYRLAAYGRSQTRLLLVILGVKINNYYIVTARDMSKNERASYRAQGGE